MNKIHNGFSLIELVIIALIIGMLALTAVPRFIEQSTEGNIAKLETAKSQLLSTIRSVSEQAKTEKLEAQSISSIKIAGDKNAEVAITFGYPSASENGLPQAMGKEFLADWGFAADPDSNLQRIAPTLITNHSGANVNMGKVMLPNCYIEYSAPKEAGDSPVVKLQTNGC